MIKKQFHSDQRIINCLNTDYDINITMLTFLPLGADEAYQSPICPCTHLMLV